MSDKHLTLMIVPHDEHAVRQFRISYRRLKAIGAGLAAIALVGLVVAMSWGRIATQASRAALLERENARLAAENAKVGVLEANLDRAERAYHRIRSMAGLAPEELGDETDRETARPVAASVPEAEAAEAPEAGEAGIEPVADRGEVETPPPPPPDVPAGWPLAKRGFVSARFTGPEPAGHPGVDIAIPSDTPVLATAVGRVIESGDDPVLGRYLVVRHGRGHETLYAHNGHLLAERGTTVARGETIATSGNTGRSSAPHLHYEVRVDGQPVDPAPFMR